MASLLALLLIALAAAPAVAQPPAPVVTAVVERGTARVEEVVVGSVEPDRSVAVAAEVAGAVVAVAARRGDTVAEGAVLVRLRTRPVELELAEARARLAEVQAQLVRATADAKRSERLFARTLVAEQEVDASRADRDALTHRRDAAKAQIALLEDRLAHMAVRAPFGGRVVAERTEVGAWVGVGDPVAEVAALDPVRIRLPVPEQTVTGLKVGQAVTIRADAVDQTRTGRIVAIVPRADAQARTFPVEVAVANPDGRLLPGMIAHATLPGPRVADALLLPKDGVVAGRHGDTVVRVADGVAEVVAVEVVGATGSRLAVRPVRGTLIAGDRVVVRGNERLRPGQPVTETATEATAAGEGGNAKPDGNGTASP